MNEHGLVVALAFGGRRVVGDGFGIPLILRHVLETCRASAQALEVLRRVPTHMAYNVTVLDATGEHAVAVLAPDREPRILASPVATNHQEGREWSEYDLWTRSSEREALLRAALADPQLERADFVRRFLEPPLHSTRYERAFGTLYTAVYAPRSGSLTLHWPGLEVRQGLQDFCERDLVVPLPRARAERA